MNGDSRCLSINTTRIVWVADDGEVGEVVRDQARVSVIGSPMRSDTREEGFGTPIGASEMPEMERLSSDGRSVCFICRATFTRSSTRSGRSSFSACKIADLC